MPERPEVILLNGAPSTGKTTLARALWDVLEPPFWYRSLDDFRKGYTDRAWDATRGAWSALGRELFTKLVDGYLHSLRAMVRAGHGVIAESVILPANIALYRDAFAGLDVFVVGVRCPLHVAEERERARAATERHLGVPIPLDVPEFELVHAHGGYDVEVDTSRTSVADGVAIVRAALEVPRSRAFDAWGRPSRP